MKNKKLLSFLAGYVVTVGDEIPLRILCHQKPVPWSDIFVWIMQMKFIRIAQQIFPWTQVPKQSVWHPNLCFVPWELLSILLLFGENIFEMKRYWKVTHLQPASHLLFGNLCKNTDFWKSTNFVVTNDPDTSARLKATLPIRCLFRPAETDWLTVFKWFLAYGKQQFWQEHFTGLLN